jgi:fumarate hydratase, class I
MEDNRLTQATLELIRRSSTCLPQDVRAAIKAAAEQEDKKSVARSTLLKILENIKQAEKQSTPICQDTGALIFHVHYGPGYRQSALRAAIEQAVAQATDKGYLRPNAVEPITGKNSGNNLGAGAPVILFDERDHPGLEIGLMQKGGGSENVSTQYSLPYSRLSAGRDLEGVRRVVLDAVFQAQGQGCAPGILGVGIGGDRGTSFLEAKAQLSRRLDDTNPDPQMRELEARLLREGNELGIGPMGFGGRTTLLGVKVGARHRHPASFFVSIAYMCWACRRSFMSLDENGDFNYA